MKRFVFAAVAAIFCCTSVVAAQTPQAAYRDNGLASLIALTNAHLGTVAAVLQVAAETPGVRTANWANVQGPLAAAKAASGITGNFSFATANGRYWVVGKGAQKASLADRAYFRAAMAGKTTIGEPIVSRTTGDQSVVISVPVVGAKSGVVGVLIVSVYLKEFSTLLKSEMQLAPNTVFFAIDTSGTILLHSDASNVFVKPADMSATLHKVVHLMVHVGDRESNTYEYRGITRTVVYERSAYTGWIFGFGTQSPT